MIGRYSKNSKWIYKKYMGRFALNFLCIWSHIINQIKLTHDNYFASSVYFLNAWAETFVLNDGAIYIKFLSEIDFRAIFREEKMIFRWICYKIMESRRSNRSFLTVSVSCSRSSQLQVKSSSDCFGLSSHLSLISTWKVIFCRCKKWIGSLKLKVVCDYLLRTKFNNKLGSIVGPYQ